MAAITLPFWKTVWKIINRANTSMSRVLDSQQRTYQSQNFRPLTLDKQAEINEIISEEERSRSIRVFGSIETFTQAKQRTSRTVDQVINNYQSGKSLVQRVRDSVINREIAPGGGPYGGIGGVGNYASMNGIPGQDPSLANFVAANIWISPQEATAIYSQKGIPETIIRKKSQSILLNGVRIRNPRIDPNLMDKVNERLLVNGLDHSIARATGNALTFGGGVLFPMFKRDNPITMGLPISTLVKLGVVGKNCVDHYIDLDRWNCVHFPAWNPTSKDFLDPLFYFIPFLGTEVSGQRVARIVTARQAGYWGTIMTMGWGISDIVGWLVSWLNYENIMQSIPKMIGQMSVLVRSMNLEGPLATEGANILDDIDWENTLRTREMSGNNIIDIDVIGKIEAIQRDFKEVPQLVRLVRQDLAAKAGTPEELVWSTEKGAFSSGDNADSAFEKQSESIRFIHMDVARQMKRVAMIHVIDSLGVDRDILKNLEYTTIEFDNPKVSNAMDKAKIAAEVSESFFKFVAGGMPTPIAAKITQQLAGNEFEIDNQEMDQLVARQAVDDERATEKHQMEIDTGYASAQDSGDDGPGAKKGHSYKDPLEQKKHEKITAGGSKKQGLQKAQNKKV